jgi:type IV pilus assembly protein PilM
VAKVKVKKKKKKNTVLGLDLGTSSVKAVEMSRNGEELSVTSCAYEEVEDAAVYDEAIMSVLDAGGFTPKHVVIGFSSRSTLLQNIAVPADREADIDTAILEEAEKYIPYDIDEAQIDYHIHIDPERHDRQIRAILAAVRQSDIEDRLEILFAAGITPARIDVELIALINALETANTGGFFLPEGKAAGIVDFGASKTLITVTDGANHVFREFPFGGIKLTEMIAHRVGCSTDDAEAAKLSPGENIDIIKDAVYPGLEDITAEIRSCLDQFKGVSGGVEAELLLLSGGLVAFPGVTPLIGRLTRMETRIFDSFGAVDASELDEEFIGSHAHEFSVAFGLACHARE